MLLAQWFVSECLPRFVCLLPGRRFESPWEYAISGTLANVT
jgi:hypothetical protein